MPASLAQLAHITITTWTSIGRGSNEEEIYFRAIGWNLQSDNADPQHLKHQLGEKEGVHLWGLSEVDADDFETFREGVAIGEDTAFEGILGTTGGNADWRSSTILNDFGY